MQIYQKIRLNFIPCQTPWPNHCSIYTATQQFQFTAPLIQGYVTVDIWCVLLKSALLMLKVVCRHAMSVSTCECVCERDL